MFKVKSPEQVFDILETLLWDHANKVRLQMEFCIGFCSHLIYLVEQNVVFIPAKSFRQVAEESGKLVPV